MKVNGEPVALDIRDGYARIRRGWTAGDTVELTLPMPVRRVVANEAVAADRGRAAIQRGPIVYAVEGVDNDNRVFDLVLPDAAALGVEFRRDMLNGVAVITGSCRRPSRRTPRGRPSKPPGHSWPCPYYAWANRGPGQMLVWLPRTAAAVRPAKKLDMKRRLATGRFAAARPHPHSFANFGAVRL